MRLAAPGLALALASTLALGGCYRSSGTAGPAAQPPGPVGPPPRLAWAEHEFQATGLPAVSADGATIVLGIQDNKSPAGFANYRFELRDRRDGKIKVHGVLTAKEAEPLYTEDGQLAGIDDRIDAANRWLAEQHQALRLAPLQQLAPEPGEEGIVDTRRASSGELTLEWKEDRLTIAKGGAPLHAQATPGSWHAKSYAVAPDFTCSNPSFLGAAHVSLDRKVAVVTVRYYGTDSCWEPPDAPHVVAW
jgi:hypothetical protein